MDKKKNKINMKNSINDIKNNNSNNNNNTDDKNKLIDKNKKRIIKDLTGKRFNHLVVLGKSDKKVNSSLSFSWKCKCDCS